jgi:chromosome segregation protein
LRARIAVERGALERLAQETTELEATIARASTAIEALHAEHHKDEKSIVGYESQLQHARNEETRLAQRGEQLVRERRHAEEERDALDRRQEEAHASIARLGDDQRLADERLTVAQRRLFEARESVDDSSRRAAEAGAAHAALIERASALAAEVQRLEEAAAEVEARASSLAVERDESRQRVQQLRQSIAAGEVRLDADIRDLDALRQAVMAADDRVTALRATSDEREGAIKEARGALDAIRAVVSELDIARATAEGDLSHLAFTCEDAVNATLDQVLVEVEQLEQAPKLQSPWPSSA